MIALTGSSQALVAALVALAPHQDLAPADQAAIRDAPLRQSMTFVENIGQWNTPARFVRLQVGATPRKSAPLARP